MGIFGFMKKSRVETSDTSMALPPIPTLDEGFPEIKDPQLPPLPDISLPPLPTEVPKMAPTPPSIEQRSKAEIPSQAPQTVLPPPPAPQPMEEEAPDITFPTMQSISEDLIPDRIPPLEDIPEPPMFGEEPVTEQEMMPIERPETPMYHEEPMISRVQERRGGPLFIRSDRFRTIIEDLDVIRTKFKEEDEIFFRITEVKNTQDQKFERFRQLLEDVQRKLLFTDRSLFEK